MATVDAERHNLAFRILVIGPYSKLFLENLPLDDGQWVPGEVHGWRPRFVFETFSVDPWSGDGRNGAELERLLPYADALVLTDAPAQGIHYSSSAMERLARALGPVKQRMRTAIYGGPALAQEWGSLTGQPPLVVAEPTASEAMTVMKALAKVLLRSNVRSTPPPPPLRSEE